jgi:rhodanese-related sulfurtransferase
MEELEITPQLASEQVRHGHSVLLDVREPEELALAGLAGAMAIPMRNVPAELQRIEGVADEKELLVFCHHGVRSLQVAVWLREHGIENVKSIAGGIDRWSREVDSSVPRY